MASSSTVKSAAKLARKQDELENKFRNTAFRTSRETYPARYFEEQEKEKDLRLLLDYAAQLRANNIPAYYLLDKKDTGIFKKKRDQEELAAFDAYIERRFNLNDPKDVRLVKEWAPEYFQRREDEMNRSLELQKHMNKIALFGVQSREDLELLFALDSGLISPSPSASWVLPAFNIQDEANAIERGIFSQHRGITMRSIGAPAADATPALINTFRNRNPTFNRATGVPTGTRFPLLNPTGVFGIETHTYGITPGAAIAATASDRSNNILGNLSNNFMKYMGYGPRTQVYTYNPGTRAMTAAVPNPAINYAGPISPLR